MKKEAAFEFELDVFYVFLELEEMMREYHVGTE